MAGCTCIAQMYMTLPRPSCTLCILCVRRMSFDQFVSRPLRPDMPRKLQKALFNVRVRMQAIKVMESMHPNVPCALGHGCSSLYVREIALCECVQASVCAFVCAWLCTSGRSTIHDGWRCIAQA